MSNLRIIQGPPTSKISKEAAATALENHREFVAGSEYTIDEIDGRWVAAVKFAEFPPPNHDVPDDADSGGPPEPPADDADDTPEPKDDKPEGDDGDKPKGDDKGKGGLEAQVHQLTEMLTKIVDALGLGGPDAMPGDDLGPDGSPMPPGGPAGPDGPEGLGSDGKQHIVHEKALKPGEAGPGQTQIGAPAFASVREDHPWKDMPKEAASFRVEGKLDGKSESEVLSELQSLASEINYNVKQFQPYVGNDGTARVAAIIANK